MAATRTPPPSKTDPFDATAPGRAPFPPLTSFQARNLATVDTHVQFAPPAALGAPGADGGEFDVGPKGLCEVAPDVVAALPAECLGPLPGRARRGAPLARAVGAARPSTACVRTLT